MLIVPVKHPTDFTLIEKEYQELLTLIETAKQNNQKQFEVENLSYYNHMRLINKNYVIKKFMRRYFFNLKVKKYYLVKLPL